MPPIFKFIYTLVICISQVFASGGVDLFAPVGCFSANSGFRQPSIPSIAAQTLEDCHIFANDQKSIYFGLESNARGHSRCLLGISIQ